MVARMADSEQQQTDPRLRQQHDLGEHGNGAKKLGQRDVEKDMQQQEKEQGDGEEEVEQEGLLAMSLDKKTMKILKYGKAHEGPRKRRRKKKNNNAQQENPNVEPDEEEEKPKLETIMETPTLEVVKENEAQIDVVDRVAEDESPIPPAPTDTIKTDEEDQGHEHDGEEVEGKNEETGATTTKKKRRRKKKKKKKKRGVDTIPEEGDMILDDDEQDHQVYYHKPSRLPLVNAAATASIAAMSVLGPERRQETFERLVKQFVWHCIRNAVLRVSGEDIQKSKASKRNENNVEAGAKSASATTKYPLPCDISPVMKPMKAPAPTMYHEYNSNRNDRQFMQMRAPPRYPPPLHPASRPPTMYGPPPTPPHYHQRHQPHVQIVHPNNYPIGYENGHHMHHHHSNHHQYPSSPPGYGNMYNSSGMYMGGAYQHPPPPPGYRYQAPPPHPPHLMHHPMSPQHLSMVNPFMPHHHHQQQQQQHMQNHHHHDNNNMQYQQQRYMGEFENDASTGGFMDEFALPEEQALDPIEDSMSLELLVHDLAMVLPNPETQGFPSFLSPTASSSSSLGSDGEYGSMFSPRATANSVSSSGNGSSNGGKYVPSMRSNSWASFPGPVVKADVESAARRAKTEVLRGIYRKYDHEREARVSLAIQMAEEERNRRIQEQLNDQYQERLERARRLEWAIKATEAERKRQTRWDRVHERKVNKRRNQWKRWTIEQEEAERNRRIRQGADADIVLAASRRKRREEKRMQAKLKQASTDATQDGATSNPSDFEYSSFSDDDLDDDDFDFDDDDDDADDDDEYEDSDSDNNTSNKDKDKAKQQQQRRRRRRINSGKYEQYKDDYEVVCPYTIVGCDKTCMRSALEAHLEQCPFRAKSNDYANVSRSDECFNLYNPLDHIVDCPYKLVGCTHSCSRADLPQHLLNCKYLHEDDTEAIDLVGHYKFPAQVDADSFVDRGLYEVVCPYATMGCQETMLRSEVQKHLTVCQFAPVTRQEEEAARNKNKMMVIAAAERERYRRLSMMTLGGEQAREMRSRHYKTLLAALIEARLTTKTDQDQESNEALSRKNSATSFGKEEELIFTVERTNSMDEVVGSPGRSGSPTLTPMRSMSPISITPVAAAAGATGGAKTPTMMTEGTTPTGVGPGPSGTGVSSPGSPLSPSPLPLFSRTQKQLHRHRHKRQALSLTSIGAFMDVDSVYKNREALINSKNAEWIVKAAEIEALRIQVEKHAIQKMKNLADEAAGQSSFKTTSLGSPIMGSSNSANGQNGGKRRLRRCRSAPGLLELTPSSSSSSSSSSSYTTSVFDDQGAYGSGRLSFSESIDLTFYVDDVELGSSGQAKTPSCSESDISHSNNNATTTTNNNNNTTNGSGSISSISSASSNNVISTSNFVSQLSPKMSSQLQLDAMSISSQSSVHSSGVQSTPRRNRSYSFAPFDHYEELDEDVLKFHSGKGGLESGSGMGSNLPQPKTLKHRAVSTSRPLSVGPPHAHWLQHHMDEQQDNLHRHLQKELVEFTWKCQQDLITFQHAVSEVQDRVQRVASLCVGYSVQVELFGSFATGLAVPELSDVDLVVFMNNSEEINPAIMCSILGRVMVNQDWIKNLKVLDRAKMPVIKMTTSSASFPLNVDITIGSPSHVGMATATFVKGLSNHYKDLGPLTLALKKFLATRGLSDPFTGGLGSYALVLMIVASINKVAQEKGKHKRKINSANHLGVQLMAFLELYGRDFDPREEAVVFVLSNNDPMIVPKYTTMIGKRFHAQSLLVPNANTTSALVVDDPVQIGNNIGASCFRFGDVRNAFADLFAKLLSYTVRYKTIEANQMDQNLLALLLFTK